MEDITMNYEQQDIDSTKGLAWLSYLGILFLIPMLVNKDSAYTKFHVNQGLILFITNIIIGAVSMIPILGWIVGGIAGIATFVFAIMGLVNAVSGKAKKLPIIGKFEIIK